ncbi:HAMP domain-containing histidine kinase [Skermanella rosea]|uniref:sensor histidine kinase n=1 Tax=Skermanella rosea TaxID=1817965 RepID=UPI0019317A2B|nr:HAMP domain-containing sensor histidine kinase [Skermanella rosea]UEM03745.1 HAMP domain-containing histidine kinase [Skermanella rosea]
MNIDIFTLVLVHSLVSVALGGLMLVFWSANRSLPGLRHWTVATLLLGASTLVSTMRGTLPEVPAILVSNGMIVLSFGFFYNGVREFGENPSRWRHAVAAVVLLVLFQAWFTLVRDDVAIRIVALSLTLCAGCLLTARELLRVAGPNMRATVLTAAALFAVAGLTLAARAASTLVEPPVPDHIGRYPAHAVHFLVSILSSILLVFCLLMMAVQRLNRDLVQRGRQLEEALHRSEDASRAKEQFLAMMSHELRTPLNAILGFSELQRNQIFGPLGHPRYLEYAGDIHSSGTHLLGLINSILDISKASAGKLEVAVAPVDPLPIADEMLRVISHAALAKRITIAHDPQPAPRCMADAQALRQILLNLLSNAVKFTGPGGMISLRIVGLDPGRVGFIVTDSGIGMDPSEIPRLLKPFEQSFNIYANAGQGTGLGLPIVDALVGLQGGRLRIDSAPGQGTTVTVELPVAA